MQAECKLDNIGNSVSHAFALLIFEGLGISASHQESLLKMLDTDDAEMLRQDRLAVLAHCPQQLGNALAIDLIDAEELRQRLMRAPDLGKNFPPHDRTGQAAKFGQEVPHRAFALEVAIPRNMRSHVML